MYQTRSTPSPFLIRPETATQRAILVMRCMEHSSRNAPIGFNKVSDFVFLYCFLGFLWVLSIPKWLINDSGPIAILFIWILELSKIHKKKNDQVWTCGPRIYYKHISRNTIKWWEHPLQMLFCHVRGHENLKILGSLGTVFFGGWGGGVLGTSFLSILMKMGTGRLWKLVK